LNAYFAEVFPRFATDSLRQDPDEFASKFGLIVELWNEVNG
jgi:hypothetical protein